MFLEGEKPEAKMKRMEQKYAALHVVGNIDKLGTPKVIEASVFNLPYLAQWIVCYLRA